MHAFIIEDDYLIGRSIQDMLGDLGFTDFTFARSEDAAVLAASGPDRIDLVTADARLLPGDGVRAAEKVRAAKRAPLIFITGYAEELKERIEGRLPGVPIVLKPIRPAELEAAVRQVLAAR